MANIVPRTNQVESLTFVNMSLPSPNTEVKRIMDILCNGVCLSIIFDGVVWICCGCNAWWSDWVDKLCKSSKLEDEVMTVNPLAFLLDGCAGNSGLGGELRQRTCGGMMAVVSGAIGNYDDGMERHATVGARCLFYAADARPRSIIVVVVGCDILILCCLLLAAMVHVQCQCCLLFVGVGSQRWVSRLFWGEMQSNHIQNSSIVWYWTPDRQIIIIVEPLFPSPTTRAKDCKKTLSRFPNSNTIPIPTFEWKWREARSPRGRRRKVGYDW